MHETAELMHEVSRPPRERLGAFLKLHREAQGLSQGEMAEKLGVDQATVSRYERGKRFEGNPSHAYGMNEQYASAPLDPELRRAYFKEERNPRIAGARDACLKATKR